MKLKSKEVLDFLTGDWSLYSTEVRSICIGIKGEDLCVNIEFWNKRFKAEKNCIKLAFNGVKEFSFAHDQKYYFYTVESYKFQQIGNMFYLSIDPDESSETPLKTDNDYLIADDVELNISMDF